MLQGHELVERFKKIGIVSTGQLYLGLPTAVDFVPACAKNDLAVIWMEGFVFGEGLLTPQLDMIADVSAKERKESWREYKARCKSKL